MRNYVMLTTEYDGYYGGGYYEALMLKQEHWDLIKDDCDMEVHLGELEGKHSECIGDIEVTQFTEEEFISTPYEPTNVDNDGNSLFEKIKYMLMDSTKLSEDEVVDMIELAETENKELSNYKIVKLTKTVRKDKVEELEKMIDKFLEDNK